MKGRPPTDCAVVGVCARGCVCVWGGVFCTHEGEAGAWLCISGKEPVEKPGVKQEKRGKTMDKELFRGGGRTAWVV